MGFFNKLWNAITGKGWQEETLEEKIQETKGKEIIPIKQEKEIKEEEAKQEEIEIKEEKQEEVKEEKKEEKKIKKERRKEETREIEQATKRYKESGNITNIQKQLKKGAIGTTEFKITNNLNELRSTYEELLSKSTITTRLRDGTTDKTLIDIIITNREKLQHRFSAEIIINTTNGTARMKIDGILAENLININNYLQEGRTYTSQELRTTMEEAQRYFEQEYGSIGGSIIVPPSNKLTITNIKTEMTFA